MNNHHQLLNSHSFLEQKMNLTGDVKSSPLYEEELFLIPKFVVVGFPMQNSQKTSYYYIELQVLEAYCYDFKNTKEQHQGLLNDVTFQYDINKQANGQLVISKSIQWIFFTSLFFKLLENDKVDHRYTNITELHMFMKTYKIILPAIAINKDSINILSYSFNGKQPANLKSIRHINNKHNYGSLSFYFNNNPQYQLQIKPSMFVTTNFNLEVKNPIILTTNFSDNCYYPILSKTVIKNITVGGKSRLDEVFTFSGNNINTTNIVPLKIKHYLISHFPKIEYWFDDKETILHKILVFYNNFNLQQNTSLNINEETSKFYQNNKIPAFLLRDNNIKDNIDQYFLEFDSTIYNSTINKIAINDEMAKNQFDLPWFESFHFKINIPFNFQTFFRYSINLKVIEESNEPIIGNGYHSIFIQKLIKNRENWVVATNFILNYDEILKFYSSDSFSFTDYKNLNHNQGKL
ncbi:hypothetical protein [Spiroplasma endosymbiont of Polydrusus pterygomalis]|uniref:hypothetical protein n=1 Tax=Spiroplasma endosymbiont of Polydrusus pterygomalis TaxID=3139327 RepID=UPI003CCB17AA